MPGYLFANDATTPIGGMTSVPTTLDDHAVGDTTTGPTESSNSAGPAGVACGASLAALAIQRIVWDGGGLYLITGVSVTGRGRTTIADFGASCIDPPPSSSIGVTSLLEYSSDGVNWTTLRTDVPAAQSFVTYVWSGSIAARYVRRTLSTSYTGNNFTNAIAAFAWNTDFRITGTPCVTPSTPTLTYEIVGSNIMFMFAGGGTNPTYCLYRVISGVENLIYTGQTTGVIYPNPAPGIEQTYRLYVCADPCGNSLPSEITIPADAPPGPPGPTPTPDTSQDGPWSRDCEPGRASSWSSAGARTAKTWTRNC